VFEDKPVPEDVKQSILRAAFEAPTAGNQMLYTILDITDPALKARLAVTCDDQPFIAKAPLVFIFLADCRRWPRLFELAGETPRAAGPGDLFLAMADACIAAQNAAVAAESLGLGSCYIGDILENCELHRQMLNLKEYLVPACMLVIGYPTEAQKARTKPAPLTRGMSCLKTASGTFRTPSLKRCGSAANRRMESRMRWASARLCGPSASASIRARSAAR
jgi:nitroreductase